MRSTVAIFAGGLSMTREAAEKVKAAGLYSIAINNSWQLAPEADALVAADPEWWQQYPEAMSFAGDKITMRKDAPEGVRYVEPAKMGPGSNSALQAAYMAVREGAEGLLLLGVDLRDDELTHHHGLHGGTLSNPTVPAFKRAREAWKVFSRTVRLPVLNCSPRSALECFPKVELEVALCR